MTSSDSLKTPSIDTGTTAGEFLRSLVKNLAVYQNQLPFLFNSSGCDRLENIIIHLDRSQAKGLERYAMDVEGYEQLARVLKMAYDQSANGKGRERHGQGLPFHEQAINSIPRLLRSGAIGASTYQTIKKTQEAIGMFERGDHAAAKAEILGSIIYAVATILTIEATEKTEN